MIDTEAAWAAGFFDGEGSINIAVVTHATSGHQYHVLDVTVAQVDPRPLLVLKERWGGAIRTRKPSTDNAKPSFYWTIRNAGAEAFIRDIRPWLRVKGEQADIGLALREIRGKVGGRRGRQQDVFDQRHELKKRLEASR